MMKTLLISCLLLTLLPPVASLTCESCRNIGTDCRRPTTEECDESSDQSCMSVVGVGKLFFFMYPLVLKSCINTELCDANDSSASIDKLSYIHSKMSCCKTDMCNSRPPEMPEHEKREPNGLKCPRCFVAYSDECEALETVSCTNEEDQCFYIGGHMKNRGGNMLGAIRGCSTASLCNRTDWLFEDVFKRASIVVTHAECTKAMDDDANEL
nr:phospholipase A2 inhibitor subunit gamma A-like [Zootoca vivipara]